MKNIAYCPIDLPLVSIDENLLNCLVTAYNTDHHDNLWKALPLMGRVNNQEDFFDAVKFEEAWERRYEPNGTVLINKTVFKPLKKIFDHIETLPLIATHCQILSQISDVGKHFDLKNQNGKLGTYIDDYPGLNDNNEPCSYKIMLNCLNENSFYVAKDFGCPNIFIKYPPDTNTFVINEKKYPHGAIKPSKSKFIVSIFGLIKSKDHRELVNKSINKYQDYVISF
jgi:hypothetical protein